MSAERSVTAELDARFSTDGAIAALWEDGRQQLADAQIYRISTVRGDGRPHVTTLMAVWFREALFFCTGPTEQKARNLDRNPHCAVTTGSNAISEGLDVVAEGEARRVADDGLLRELAAEWESKYGSDWHYDVHDGAFHHQAGEAWIYEVLPTTAFGFAKGALAGQTRWRFSDGRS